jgi:hypothetical protein
MAAMGVSLVVGKVRNVAMELMVEFLAAEKLLNVDMEVTEVSLVVG